jgi:hypothetical protein
LNNPETKLPARHAGETSKKGSLSGSEAAELKVSRPKRCPDSLTVSLAGYFPLTGLYSQL